MYFASSAIPWSAATPDAAVAETEFSLYILRCADGSLYTGIAADVDKRLAQHESGIRGAKYLRGRAPLQIVFAEVAGNRATASQLEYRVKKLSRAKKLDLVDGRIRLNDLRYDQVLEEGCA